MRQKMKQLMGILLSISLMLGLMPGMSLTAYADGTTYNPASTYTGFSDLITNDTEVTISEVSGKTWYVIACDDSTVTLLSKESFGEKAFNSNGWTGNRYETSTIKTYVDGLTGEGQPLAEISSVISDLSLMDMSWVYELSVTKKKGAGADWWLCSRGYEAYEAQYVSGSNGVVFDTNMGYTLGVRPYLKLNLSSVIFSSESNTFSLPVTGVTLNPSTAQTITVGDKVPFTASIEPAGALKKVKWSANSGAVKLYSDANCTTEVGSAATDKLTVYAKGISAGTATVTVTATNGTDDTSDDKSANCAVTVNKKNPDATAPVGLTATYGQTLTDVTLPNPEGNTPGIWAWVDNTQSVGNVVSPAATFKANFTPTDTTTYNTVENVDVAVTVGKADPTAPIGLTATYGQTLADVTLPDGWTWADSTQSVGNVVDPATTFKANFAGDDNHNAASDVDVSVTVNKANAVPATVTANNRTYDGTEKPLVSEDKSTLVGGEMQYALGTETEATQPYTTSIPTATDAGTYYIWYKVVGDSNHSDTEPASVKVTINYTVTFETDGGTPVPEAQLVESGKNATYPDTVPTRDGSSFEGWYLNDAPFRFSSTPITSNITLTAKWKANQYTIIWVDDDGTYLAATTAAHGETPTLEAPAKLSDEQFTYEFKAWDPVPQAATESAIYHATYTTTERVFTITVDNADTNGSITAPESGRYQDTVPLTVTPNEHYEIESVTYYDGSSHNVAPDGTGAYSFPMPAANVTVSAKFSPVYTVSFDVEDGTPVPEAQRVTSGKYAAAPDTVPAKDGSRFEGWYLNDAPFLFNTTPIEGNITLTAKWQANEFSIVWVDSDGAFLGTTTVSYGEMPTFAPPAKLPDAQFAYAFDAWDPAPQPATATAVYRATYIPVPLFDPPTFTLPASTKSVGESAFEGLPMTIVEIPDGCTSIGAKAFKDCANLTQIRIPASVTSIDTTAFDGCVGVFIYGTADSAAQTFCADHANCTFVAEN